MVGYFPLKIDFQQEQEARYTEMKQRESTATESQNDDDLEEVRGTMIARVDNGENLADSEYVEEVS